MNKRMRSNSLRLIVLLFVSVGMAQILPHVPKVDGSAYAQSTSPSPCPANNLQQAMAEWQAAAGRVTAATDNLIQQQLVRELADTKRQLQAEQNNSGIVCAYYKGVEGQLQVAQASTVVDKNLIASLTAERNKLQAKINRANRRWFARKLHVGRIGER